MVWLSAYLPFEQAEQVFERIGRHPTPGTSIWRQAQTHGQRMKQDLEREQERVAVERVVLPAAGLDHRRRQGISMDGGKAHVRGEGWKEFKVGTVYDVAHRLARDPQTDEWVEEAHGVKMTYRAVLGTAEEFAPAFWALAVQRAVPQAADLAVTADGAEWIWNLTADYFPQSVQIVDWYHAGEHLAQAATALYPENEGAAERWNRERRRDLYLGAIHRITGPLDKANLPGQSQYFHTHQRRMQYQEFREGGYPIRSGTVESGIKQFKQRLSGAGMRWSRAGAKRMLVIRAEVMSGNFDTRWTIAPN